jgi:hypothetical protein
MWRLWGADTLAPSVAGQEGARHAYYHMPVSRLLMHASSGAYAIYDLNAVSSVDRCEQ